MAQRLTFRKLKLSIKNERKKYLYTTTFETIAKYFLDQLLDIEVFKSKFSQIKASFKS